MTLNETVHQYKDLISGGFAGGAGIIEHAHQTIAEMALDLAEEMGLPHANAEVLKTKHHRVIHVFYDAIVRTNDEIGDLVVSQFDAVTRFAGTVDSMVLGPDATRWGKDADEE